MTRNVTFLKLHSSLLFASLKSVVCPTAPGSSSKLTLQHFHITYISNYNTSHHLSIGQNEQKAWYANFHSTVIESAPQNTW